MAAKYADERLSLPAVCALGKIGVVTVLYNSASVLGDFFASLEAQTHTDFIVYCIDNNSTDDSVSQCRTRGERYRIIENGANRGVPAGNNVGTRAAIADGCEFVLFLNNDVMFPPDLLAQLLKGMDEHRCSMTTPVMYYFDRPNIIWTAGGFFQSWLGYRPHHHGDGYQDIGQYTTPRPVQYTPTCCVLVRRHLFTTIGLMDERYFAYYDDTDFMLRAYQAGESLYLLPHAKLWHKVSSLIGTSSPFRTRYVHRNHALYVHKHLGTIAACCISLLYCSGYLYLSVIRRISLTEARDRIHYWREGVRQASASPCGPTGTALRTVA